MKKIALFLVFLLAFTACRYDDTFLSGRIDDLEVRVQNLEQLCQKMNTNISAMQSLVDALRKQDYIKTITPIKEGGETIGYTITFAYGDPVTIYHGADGKDGADGIDGVDGADGVNGADGKDGYTPVIGVRLDEDGVYYWTLDGEWLTDDDGNRIPAAGKDGVDGIDGISPVLEIRDGFWYVSYDGGNTWACMGKATGEDGADGSDGSNGSDGSDGADGKDGITPLLKIENRYWYVSYDNGTTWAQLGRATGRDGADGINGADGKDGITPKLEIREGYWYISYDNGVTWAQLGKATGEDGADGSAGAQGPTGESGTDGITPQLKIEEDYWYISYDNGASWTKLGKATGENGLNGADGEPGDAYFSDVTIEEDYVVFVLADGGQTLKLPFYKGFSLSMDFADPTVDYVVVGEEDLVLEYDVANADGNLVTMVFSDLTTVVDESAKTITVKSPSSFAGLDDVEAVTLLVSDGSSTAMASVNVNVVDINPVTNEVKAQTAEDLLRWAYIVNDGNYDLDLTLENDITMPLFEVVADPEGRTYRITDKPITVDSDGVPSGSNWVPVCNVINDYPDTYTGHVNGGDCKISGLRMNYSSSYTGFIGYMFDGTSIKDLTFENAVIYGGANTGIVGKAQNGAIIENVNVIQSKISGSDRVGGIAGYIQRRKGGSRNYNEEFVYIRNCTIDDQSSVIGNTEVGGICGNVYASVIIGCSSEAGVTGVSKIGGIAGYFRDYWGDKNNSARAYNAYAIGCISKGLITATGSSGCCGGIIGNSLADINNHVYTNCFIVSCLSLSEVAGGQQKLVVGRMEQKSAIVSTVAKKQGDVDYIDNSSNVELLASDSYSLSSEITSDIVDEMNAAIEVYNGRNDIEGQTCPYRWQYNAGDWPTLVEEQVSSN